MCAHPLHSAQCTVHTLHSRHSGGGCAEELGSCIYCAAHPHRRKRHKCNSTRSRSFLTALGTCHNPLNWKYKCKYKYQCNSTGSRGALTAHLHMQFNWKCIIWLQFASSAKAAHFCEHKHNHTKAHRTHNSTSSARAAQAQAQAHTSTS